MYLQLSPAFTQRYLQAGAVAVLDPHLDVQRAVTVQGLFHVWPKPRHGLDSLQRSAVTQGCDFSSLPLPRPQEAQRDSGAASWPFVLPLLKAEILQKNTLFSHRLCMGRQWECPLASLQLVYQIHVPLLSRHQLTPSSHPAALLGAPGGRRSPRGWGRLPKGEPRLPQPLAGTRFKIGVPGPRTGWDVVWLDSIVPLCPDPTAHPFFPVQGKGKGGESRREEKCFSR